MGCNIGMDVEFEKIVRPMETKEFEKLRELMKVNRSYRRFRQDSRLSEGVLSDIVDLVRYCGSGRNLQPLKYKIINGEPECDVIFPMLAWAGYLTDWDGPSEGERPAAYIVQCLDTSLTKNPLCDEGLQLEALTLGATALGLGCCIIKSFNAEGVKRLLALPDHIVPTYVVALGYPVESVVIEAMHGEDYKYWRDDSGIHHVPKRSLEEILLK